MIHWPPPGNHADVMVLRGVARDCLGTSVFRSFSIFLLHSHDRTFVLRQNISFTTGRFFYKTLLFEYDRTLLFDRTGQFYFSAREDRLSKPGIHSTTSFALIPQFIFPLQLSSFLAYTATLADTSNHHDFSLNLDKL